MNKMQDLDVSDAKYNWKSNCFQSNRCLSAGVVSSALGLTVYESRSERITAQCIRHSHYCNVKIMTHHHFKHSASFVVYLGSIGYTGTLLCYM